MKQNKIYVLLIIVFSLLAISMEAQIQKPKKQPFADQKLYHFGFLVGIHTQDMILSHTGYTSPTGEAWFAEIPSYSVGFSVGIIADRYISEHFNLRVSPSLHFGEKGFVFREQKTGEEYKNTFKTNYFSIPLNLKFSANRIQDYRPYLLAGGYANMDMSSKKDQALRFKRVDYGLEFGVGCNFYLAMFKLCPELRFSFGLTDIISKDNSDLTDKDLLKFRDSMSSGKTRMISLIFNFE